MTGIARAPDNNPLSVELVCLALGGDAGAARRLFRELSPVVHARVARILVKRRGAARGRDLRQEVEDFTQEVFVALFDDNAKTLRRWQPELGLSLKNFVGLVAERQAISILRNGRRSPWTEDPTVDVDLQADLHAGGPRASDHEGQIATRQLLARVHDELRLKLSPQGLQMFHLIWVEQQSVPDIGDATGLSRDAIYAWKMRLRKIIKIIAHDLSSDAGGSQRTPKRGGDA